MSFFNWLTKKAIPWFTSLGLTSRTVTLEVHGRKTGRPIRVSLARTDYGGNCYFVSLAGEVDWVKNVRAFTHSGAQSSRLFFGLGPSPNLEEIEKIVERYLVFKIEAE